MQSNVLPSVVEWWCGEAWTSSWDPACTGPCPWPRVPGQHTGCACSPDGRYRQQSTVCMLIHCPPKVHLTADTDNNQPSVCLYTALPKFTWQQIQTTINSLYAYTLPSQSSPDGRYSQTCLNRTPVGPRRSFGFQRCSVFPVLGF